MITTQSVNIENFDYSHKDGQFETPDCDELVLCVKHELYNDVFINKLYIFRY
jgi:hypothetical protein